MTNGTGKLTTFLLIRVSSPRLSGESCELMLLAPADATLGHVDSMLRRLWLACCGHLSKFDIELDGDPTLDEVLDQPDFMGLLPHMYTPSGAVAGDFEDTTLAAVVEEFDGMEYEYDMGSTTYLTVAFVAELEGPRNALSQIDQAGIGQGG